MSYAIGIVYLIFISAVVSLGREHLLVSVIAVLMLGLAVGGFIRDDLEKQLNTFTSSLLFVSSVILLGLGILYFNTFFTMAIMALAASGFMIGFQLMQFYQHLMAADELNNINKKIENENEQLIATLERLKQESSVMRHELSQMLQAKQQFFEDKKRLTLKIEALTLQPNSQGKEEISHLKKLLMEKNKENQEVILRYDALEEKLTAKLELINTINQQHSIEKASLEEKIQFLKHEYNQQLENLSRQTKELKLELYKKETEQDSYEKKLNNVHTVIEELDAEKKELVSQLQKVIHDHKNITSLPLVSGNQPGLLNEQQLLSQIERVEFEKMEVEEQRDKLQDELSKAQWETASLKESIKEINRAGNQLPFDKLINLACSSQEPTPAECLTIISSILADKIIFLDSAMQSAQEALTFKRGRLLMEMFRKLACDYLPLYLQGGDNKARTVFTNKQYAANESQTVINSQELSKTRKFMYKGESIFMGQHLKVGVSEDIKHTIRIHFLVDKVEQKIVVGYCGEHLPLLR